ncbi:MAG TPA: sigma factor-like helix-turn-helix DNA-binding protein, partial [Candidatus Ratteibacteria bacterium]|nr:sigma factor-like helix-turn-helix DNA-binding protein [Candidatus Ratteibacteria bacterium]
SDNNTEVEKILKLREIIEKLPQLYKEILFLRYNQDLKESEISEILKIPVGTVKSRLSKAKKVLIKFWNKK